MSKYKAHFYSWLLAWVEITIFFPVLITVGIIFIPQEYRWIWLFTLPLYWLSGQLLISIGYRWSPWIIKVCCILLAAGISLYFHPSFMGYVVLFMLQFYFALRGIRAVGTPWENFFQEHRLAVSILSYFALYFLFRYHTLWQDYYVLFNVFGIFTCILFVFLTSTLRLKSAFYVNGSIRQVPLHILRNNGLFIAATFMIIAFISQLYQVPQLLMNVFSWAGKIINGLLVLKKTVYEKRFAVMPQPLGSSGSIPEFIKHILYILMTTIASALVLFVLYLLLKHLYLLVRSLIHSIIAKFKNSFHASKDWEGFIDKKEKIPQKDSFQMHPWNSFKQWLSRRVKHEPSWHELSDNKERIRFIYRRLVFHAMKQGYQYQNSRTPRENCKEIQKEVGGLSQEIEFLSDLYNEARYGNNDISNLEINKVLSLKDLKEAEKLSLR